MASLIMLQTQKDPDLPHIQTTYLNSNCSVIYLLSEKTFKCHLFEYTLFSNVCLTKCIFVDM